MPLVFACAFLLLSAWNHAQAAAAPAPKPAKASAKPSPREFVIFSTPHRGHLVLVRSLPSGLCKGFLSQKPGEGWVISPPSHNQGDDFLAAASPDGTRLAFYSSRSGAVNLWVSLADGSQAEALTDEDIDIADPTEIRENGLAFSPDGKSLGFLKNHNLWIADLASKAIQALSEGQGVKGFAWSPSGKWLAFVQLNSLRRVSVTGYPTENLASDPGIEASMSWMPDDKTEELLYYNRGAAKVDKNKKSELVFPSGYKNNRVQVMPGKADSYLILGPMPNGTGEVFLGSLGKKEKGTQVTQGGADSPFFSGDGKAIYFIRDKMLWRCALNGSEARPVTQLQARLPKLCPLLVELSGECK